MKNNKGFTLVELLAVIVILAVVMLIGFTAVGPMMTRSRKSALGTEGISLITAAKSAYQAEQMTSNSKIKATSSVCFDLKWLKNKGYYSKDDDTYEGSVYVKYANGNYSYYFWITNGTYYYGGVDATLYNANGYDLAVDGKGASMGTCPTGTLSKYANGNNVASPGNLANTVVKCTVNNTTATCA